MSKKLFLILNILFFLLITILLFVYISFPKLITIEIFVVILFIINLFFYSSVKTQTLSSKFQGNTLQNRVSDFINLISMSKIDQNLLKETYVKTMKLFESLVKDHETDALIYEHFKNLTENEILRSARYKSKFSLLLVKINNSSQFGKTLAVILKALNALFKNVLRDMDVISRYDKDTFIILLPETGLKGANRAAERLLEQLTVLNNRKLTNYPVEISIGISTFPYNGQYYDELLNKCIENLKQAERLGGNQIIFHAEKPE
ncbi:MAG: GGDEF domain-containing protein [Promethearchaeota archaeon]